MPQITNYIRSAPNARKRKKPGYRMFAMFDTLGDIVEYGTTPAPWKATSRYRGLGDDPPEINFDQPEPTVDCAKTPDDIVCQIIHDPATGGASADPQTAYTACLRGGGSFGSCKQIPGVTPQMIAAAKSSGAGKPAAPMSLGKTAIFVAGAGLVLYLLTKK